MRTVENGTDAVNEIYCVNLAASPKRELPLFSIINSFLLLQFILCGPSRPSTLHSLHPSAFHSLQCFSPSFFAVWSLVSLLVRGGPWRFVSSFLYSCCFVYSVTLLIIIVIEGSFFEGSSSK